MRVGVSLDPSLELSHIIADKLRPGELSTIFAEVKDCQQCRWPLFKKARSIKQSSNHEKAVNRGNTHELPYLTV